MKMIYTIVGTLTMMMAAMNGAAEQPQPAADAATTKPTGNTSAEVDEPAKLPKWKQEANDRIEKYRKGDFEVTIVLNGKPLPEGKAIDFRQTRSHFHFGTCVTGNLYSDNPDEVQYRAFILKYFNTLVAENYMKWYSLEKKQDERNYKLADDIVRFAKQHDLALRGHCLFWSKPKFVQKWVQELDKEELREQMASHLEDTVKHFRGDVICWDVNNEMLDGSWYKEQLGEEIRTWMFKRAHELDPNAELFVNEYSVLGNDEKTARYIDMIQKLQQAGAPVGGIGVQEHGCERILVGKKVVQRDEDGRPERQHAWQVTPEQIIATLDKLGELDLPIHLTEISAKTPDPEARADAIEAIFRLGYSHPKVESVMLWGFWENRHWLGKNAGLVDKDWKLTPAGERLEQMLLKEWRTNTTVDTDEQGQASFRGFYGSYDVTVEHEGKTYRGTVKLWPDATKATVVLQ